MKKWLLLHYRVPRQPTAPRVAVWRKLKQLGAILLHDSVWILPATPRTTEQFQWLATEIDELGGEAMLWKCDALLSGQEEQIASQFAARTDEAYRAILKTLRTKSPDLNALSRAYQETAAQDYFQSPLAEKTRRALLAKGSK